MLFVLEFELMKSILCINKAVLLGFDQTLANHRHDLLMSVLCVFDAVFSLVSSKATIKLPLRRLWQTNWLPHIVLAVKPSG